MNNTGNKLMQMELTGTCFRIFLALEECGGENYNAALAKMTKLKPGNSLRAIKTLKTLSIIQETKRIGHIIFYQINPDFSGDQTTK
ncbi:MAG TPA: hypothetical protein VM577_10775 [Anaerovoracaceae bacterium]|nr:hypothetical protein [Anaerovoracaceae bacterium]